jgi:hypothetical protein
MEAPHQGMFVCVVRDLRERRAQAAVVLPHSRHSPAMKNDAIVHAERKPLGGRCITTLQPSLKAAVLAMAPESA